MTIIKPKYSKYSHRVLSGLLRVVIISFIWMLLLLIPDFGNGIEDISIAIFGIFSIILSISVFRNSKDYLTEIRVNGNNYEFEIVTFDKPKEKIKSKISETRIKVLEIFFPFTKFGRNYKLVIETKQGKRYKQIFQQYEIGNWNIEMFKDTIKFYNETKGVTVSTASITRSNFSTNKN
ncbi:hypothetical protein LA303_07945 [Candidatus Sulfidibacterium hydrothermale]|uniref:hypothetical protein n=1 Tax=Candidatus Sulfidibacterium hydrothermale TaxID=2875962 RepID=UPI001F0B61FC|nr:hypothetical protein [Candidatus Sulfidibacterium hydrothermale]UBM61355.1 hypothetical protein LA303_07945 [Candidatus Sulfidibacterium hydrothermale]